MSRGLGKTQRAVLLALHEYPDETSFRWRGGEITPQNCYSVRHGHEWIMHSAILDLRAASKWLARKQSRREYGCITAGFRAGFSRAVRGLVARGLLEQVSHAAPGAELRYVRLSANGILLALSERELMLRAAA